MQESARLCPLADTSAGRHGCWIAAFLPSRLAAARRPIGRFERPAVRQCPLKDRAVSHSAATKSDNSLPVCPPAKERVHTRVGGTNRKCLYCSRTMSKLLVTQFERFAECCLELARSSSDGVSFGRYVGAGAVEAFRPVSASGPNQMTVLTMRSRRSISSLLAQTSSWSSSRLVGFMGPNMACSLPSSDCHGSLNIHSASFLGDFRNGPKQF